jgi:hypothetical protein
VTLKYLDLGMKTQTWNEVTYITDLQMKYHLVLKLRTRETIPTLPPYVFLASLLIKHRTGLHDEALNKHKENFTFTFMNEVQ